MLNVLSLGAGVQSSTMALMAAEGELTPMPDCAIFADTGAEPKHVYDQLDFIQANVPFPVYRVMEGEGLETDILKGIDGGRCATPPFFTLDDDGNKGILRRQCTAEYKIKPIQQKVRQLMGLEKGQRGPKEVAVRMWIGISMDESVRMKPNQTKWIENVWPLIEKDMYRYDCIDWMREHGYREPSKSACYFCPYHDNSTWQNMMDHDQDSWHRSVRLDTALRKGMSGVKSQIFIHRSMQPLTECDFDPARDQFDMFDNECEGMCGV